MHLKLSEGVPGCKFEEEVEDNFIVGFGEKAIKDGYRTLSRQMRVCISKLDRGPMYLKDVFKVSRSKLCQVRYIGTELANCVSPKRGHHSESSVVK